MTTTTEQGFNAGVEAAAKIADDAMKSKDLGSRSPKLIAAAIRSLKLPETAPAGDAGPRWRHKKRGSTYTEIGRGKVQSEHWRDPDIDGDYDSQRVDMREVVIYRADSDGSLWVRPREEFEDGRFEPATSVQGGE